MLSGPEQHCIAIGICAFSAISKYVSEPYISSKFHIIIILVPSIEHFLDIKL